VDGVGTRAERVDGAETRTGREGDGVGTRAEREGDGVGTRAEREGDGVETRAGRGDGVETRAGRRDGVDTRAGRGPFQRYGGAARMGFLGLERTNINFKIPFISFHRANFFSATFF